MSDLLFIRNYLLSLESRLPRVSSIHAPCGPNEAHSKVYLRQLQTSNSLLLRSGRRRSLGEGFMPPKSLKRNGRRPAGGGKLVDQILVNAVKIGIS